MPDPRPRTARLDIAGGPVVHALFDGGLAGALADYHNIPGEKLAALLAREGQEVPPRPDLTCFLIEDGKSRLLVDAGGGFDLGPGAGALVESLALIGLRPADIDAVFLTHLHGDHVAGLIGRDGSVLFPRAEILMHSKEFRFWFEDRPVEKTARRERQEQLLDRKLGPYRDRIRSVEDGPLTGGASVRLLPGHTPGHAGLMIGTQGADRLFIAGDIVHLPEIQLPFPEVTTAYDWDEDIAAATRQAVLDEAAREGIVLAGMHFRWPTLSRVTRRDGRFLLSPVATGT